MNGLQQHQRRGVRFLRLGEIRLGNPDTGRGPTGAMHPGERAQGKVKGRNEPVGQ